MSDVVKDHQGTVLAFWPAMEPWSNGHTKVMSPKGECLTCYGESGMGLNALQQAAYVAAALRIVAGIQGVADNWKELRAKLVPTEPAPPAPPPSTPAYPPPALKPMCAEEVPF